MVTHLTNNPLGSCLNKAERTGSLIVSVLVDTLTLNMTASGVQRLVNDPS
jgi:hypothetical protein